MEPLNLQWLLQNRDGTDLKNPIEDLVRLLNKYLKPDLLVID
jgi:hypothetical protein